MNALYTWTTFDHEQKERPADWYWAVGIIIVALIAVAIIWGDIIFAVLIALGGGTLLLYTQRPPHEITCTIDRDGMHIEKQMFPWDTLIRYDIHSQDGEHTLLLETKKIAHRTIILPLPESAPLLEIRRELGEHIPEETVEFTFADILMDRLGF